ncbi:DUF4279 domain-containing protein [Verrucomicrobiaceae bacterium R5-34]|nr:DUF4279 domain-containing protein [Verrucomicrobiaceae bacterium R5-34]
MSSHTAYVYFGLKGDFDPVRVDEMIPLDSDMCLAKHSREPHFKTPVSSILRYAELNTEDDLIDIYDLADRAVDILSPYTELFVDAIKKHKATATFQAVIQFPNSEEISTPAIGFSERVVRFISSVGGSIDIDTYRR